jgi:hypothetical protein
MASSRTLGGCDESLSLQLRLRQRASQRLRSPAAFSPVTADLSLPFGGTTREPVGRGSGGDLNLGTRRPGTGCTNWHGSSRGQLDGRKHAGLCAGHPGQRAVGDLAPEIELVHVRAAGLHERSPGPGRCCLAMDEGRPCARKPLGLPMRARPSCHEGTIVPLADQGFRGHRPNTVST